MEPEFYIPSAKPFFPDEIIARISSDIKDVLNSGRLILGPKAQIFEERFAEYIGVKYAISVNSCTTALEISLKFLDVKNYEVVVPTNTFIATPNSVIYAGGKPVFADIKKETLCLDPEDMLERITKKTRGVIVVHIAGLPCPDINKIKEICEDHGLFLVEDAAHAHGAMIGGKKAGSLGDIGCFSFYPTKVMTTCTGGMITTNDPNLVNFAKSLRHHGQGTSLEEIVNFGNDWVMDEISAILGIYQLEILEEHINRRNKIAKIYTDNFEKSAKVTPFKTPPDIRHSYYKYPVLLPEYLNVLEVRKKLKEEFKIEAGAVYYPPCHLQPLYKKQGCKEGMLPEAEYVLRRHMCLPIHAYMNTKEINYTIESVKKICL